MTQIQNSNPIINQGDNRNVSYPDQLRDSAQQLASTVKIILEIPKSITSLRRTFRGEALYQAEDGNSQWIQVVKPMFIQLDKTTRQPIKKLVHYPNGEEKLVYIPNDEAIEEILSILFFMGMNNITPLTNLDENNILDDLREVECKLAALLCLKQVDWGMDKELLPMIMTKLKTPIQDARYMCAQGGTLKALTQQVSRIESVMEDMRPKNKLGSPYG